MSIPALIACRVRRVLAPGLLAVCLVLPLAGLASPWPCERLLIAGNSEYPPFLWQPNDDSNELKGALPQLLTEIFDGLEVTANVRHIGSWARVQKLARNGDIDLVAGAFMTEERAGYLDYVRPAITRIPTVVWFPRGREFPFRRWSDLEGKVGSTLIGNSFGQAFDDYAANHLRLETVRSIEQSFRMAMAGRVDYVLYEALQGRVKLGRNDWQDQFTASDQVVSVENLYFAFPKQSRCNTQALREAFANALRLAQNQGRIDALIEENISHYTHH